MKTSNVLRELFFLFFLLLLISSCDKDATAPLPSLNWQIPLDDKEESSGSISSGPSIPFMSFGPACEGVNLCTHNGDLVYGKLESSFNPGEFYKVNAKSGEIIWQEKVTSLSLSLVSVANVTPFGDELRFTTKGSFYSIDLNTGKRLFRIEASDELNRWVLFDGDYAYYPYPGDSADEGIKRINLMTRETEVIYKIADDANYSEEVNLPLVVKNDAGDLLVFTQRYKYERVVARADVVAINTDSKEMVWSQSTQLQNYEEALDVSTNVATDNERLFFSFASDLYCVDPLNGELIWSTALESDEHKNFVNLLFDDNYLIYYYHGVLYSFDLTNGKKNWDFHFEYQHFVQKVHLLKNKILAIGWDMYLIDLSSGKLLKRFDSSVFGNGKSGTVQARFEPAFGGVSEVRQQFFAASEEAIYSLDINE